MKQTCFCCREEKLIGEFYYNRRDEIRFGKCKTCCKIAARAQFQKKRTEVYRQRREYQRKYRRTPRGKELLRLAIARYPERYRARRAVQQKLPSASTKWCAECGKKAAHWHHHLGYKPRYRYAVIPVCTKCHAEAEKKLRALKIRGRRQQ